MNEADIIRGAREILSDPARWTQAGWCVADQMCVEGALAVAYGIDARALTMYDEAPEPLVRAAKLVLEHAPKPDGRETWTWLSVFNDHDTTTHQDVLNVLDKTLADLGEL